MNFLAIGIATAFVEINLQIGENAFWWTIRYLFSIIIPLAIIFMELKGFNFSELLSVTAAKFFMMIGDTKDCVCIVPAFMFDKQGYRLGYGKGYYDRYLSRYKGSTIGICYGENLVNELFHGKYDRTVDMIVTEKDIISDINQSKGGHNNG